MNLQENLGGSACSRSGLAGRSTLQVGGNLSTLEDLCQMKHLRHAGLRLKPMDGQGGGTCSWVVIMGASCP